METIFTKIVKREVPAKVVFEDDMSLAFLDINPVSKGHLLLITKEPYPWMTDVPEQVVGRDVHSYAASHEGPQGGTFV